MERETYNPCSPFIEAVVAIGAYARSRISVSYNATTRPTLLACTMDEKSRSAIDMELPKNAIIYDNVRNTKRIHTFCTG